MKSITAAIFALTLSLGARPQAQINRVLDIPPRLQWDNDGGYCGETSIQMIGLYYGNYISQDFCRGVAGGEVLIGDENGEMALDALGFTIDKWDYNQATPQYQPFLVWMKSHIARSHPVIYTVYIQGGNFPTYDHIVPAIGIHAADTTTFQNSDELIFNDCYANAPFTRSFSTLWDTRAMNGNGADHDYCIPRDVDFGCAVTGIKDVLHETKPVHVVVNRWDEPNVSIGEAPVTLQATVVAQGLTTGARYAMLRYDNYLNVPASGFTPTNATSVVYFTATGSQHPLSATFMSNSAVFFRCVPDIFTGTAPTSVLDAPKYELFPNPSTGRVTIVAPAKGAMEVFDAAGKLMCRKALQDRENQFDLSALAAGTYWMHLQSSKGRTVQKWVKH